MNRIELDGRAFKSVEVLHAVLKKELALPEFYGANLDALWDCLGGFVDLPLHIEWKGFAASKHQLGGYADRLLELFKEAETEIEGFSVRVED